MGGKTEQQCPQVSAANPRATLAFLVSPLMEELKEKAPVSSEEGPGYHRAGAAPGMKGRRQSAWPGRAEHLGVEVTHLDP